MRPRVARFASPYIPALLVCGFLTVWAIRGILDLAGRAAVPLDDAYIHFQFARNLAAGRLFEYVRGEGYVAGATSFAWPVVLSAFHLAGFTGSRIIWAAWALGAAAHAALTVETYYLTRDLAGRPAAVGAAATSALCAGFVWFAASGMETMALAWILTRTARLASAWCDGSPTQRTPSARRALVAHGLLAPLVRPEGALASLISAAALSAKPGTLPGSSPYARMHGVLPLAGIAVMPAVHAVMTGSSSSTTMLVKWLPLNPYYASVSSLAQAVLENVVILLSTLLNGEQWGAVLVPTGSMPFALFGLAAVPVVGGLARRPWTAAWVLVLAAGLLLPCTYHTFLWNRLRYLWPFVPAWIIALACGARAFGYLLAPLHPRTSAIVPALALLPAGAFALHLPLIWEDLAKSARAIDQQQVHLASWARDHLPLDAVLGVNDTGAIAYLSERRTFDIVGLTTQGEGRYWVAGAGSRFEHYEHLQTASPSRFPTHFIVYDSWMRCPQLLGPKLTEATVHDQSILGGSTMGAYLARIDLLGTGARPIRAPTPGPVWDELDVADLESEAAHGYLLDEHSGNDISNYVYSEVQDGSEPNSREWADGGRFQRRWDIFVAHLPHARTVCGIARLVGHEDIDSQVRVQVRSALLGNYALASGRAVEVPFVVPAALADMHTPIEVHAVNDSSFGSLHYWFYPCPRDRAAAQSSGM